MNKFQVIRFVLLGVSIVLLLVFVLAGPALIDSFTGDRYGEGYKVYTDPDGGFTVEIPSGYSMIRETVQDRGAFKRFVYAAKGNSLIRTFMVSRYPGYFKALGAKSDKDRNALRTRAVKEILESVQGRSLDFNAKLRNGTSVIRTTGSGNAGDEAIYFVIEVRAEGDHLVEMWILGYKDEIQGDARGEQFFNTYKEISSSANLEDPAEARARRGTGGVLP